MKKTVISLVLALITLAGFISCSDKYSGDTANGDLTQMYGTTGGLAEATGGLAEAPLAMDEMEAMPNASLSDEPDVYDLRDDEQYGRIIENEFIKSSEQPLSTFSADVDTASYTFFRKLVQSGYDLRELRSTAGKSLRIEEMINYFDYGYDEPQNGELFSVNAEIAPCPWNSENVLLMLGLKTEKAVEKSKNNLVFLIDVSGSMYSEDKLPLLQKSFSYLISQLGEDDTVSIVTYSGMEEVVLDGCAGNKNDLIMKAVNSLHAEGSTNGEAGLKMAYQLAEKHFVPDGNNRIIMASDGDLNVGISSADELAEFVGGKRDAGVFISVLGFGTGNYRDANMEALADNGNGVYYYVDSELEAEKIFGTDLLSTLYTVAKDTKLQIEFNADAVEEYRLIGYENRLLSEEDFRDDTKDAGEIGAGHSVTVLYELKLDDMAYALNSYWMNLSVRYKRPAEDKAIEENYPIGAESFTDDPGDPFRFASAVAETCMIIRESRYIGDITLENIIETLDGCDTSGDIYKAQFKELIKALNEER